ncbi:MAG: hypothetical protein RI964_85 [Pseudomonadota bacterium]|jgi:CBS domain-containing protein
MKTIQRFLSEAHQSIHTITPDDTVYNALTLMAQGNLSVLMVVEGDKLSGIISERDYARKVALHGKSSKETPVRDIMTPAPFTVRPDQTLDVCMSLMIEKKIRHLPVLSVNNEILGIISIRDVVKEVMDEQRFLIAELQRYIAG